MLVGARRGTVDDVVNHAVYEIATGRWPPGFRLPSVRDAERRWGVNRLTVLRAYRRLEERGLVSSSARSGFHVRQGSNHARLTRHRHELERLFESLAPRIRLESGLSVLGGLRYLSRLAEIRAREHPEHAFVECTSLQAEGHVAEIAARLDVPVTPLTLAAIDGRRARVPASVHTLLTSHWHHAALEPLANPGKLAVVSIPIEISEELRDLLADVDEAVVLDTSESDVAHLARDIRELGTRARIREEVVDDVQAALAGPARARSRSAVLLSPRFWGSVDERWRSDPRVRPIRFRIGEAGWPLVADALGLPLGEIADGQRRAIAS